jgi:hypothetical protein
MEGRARIERESRHVKGVRCSSSEVVALHDSHALAIVRQQCSAAEAPNTCVQTRALAARGLTTARSMCRDVKKRARNGHYEVHKWNVTRRTPQAP